MASVRQPLGNEAELVGLSPFLLLAEEEPLHLSVGAPGEPPRWSSWRASTSSLLQNQHWVLCVKPPE